MAMQWFRRNRKVLTVVLVGMLMAVWGTLPALNYLAQRRTGVRGRIRGRAVTEQQLTSAFRQLDVCDGYGLLRGADVLNRFIFADRPEQMRGRTTFEAVWRYLILVRAADGAGVQVTRRNLELLMSLRRLPVGNPDLQLGLANLLKIFSLLAYHEDSVHVTETALWAQYIFKERSAKSRLVELRPDIFLSQVSASPDELRAFYEEHKDTQPDRRAGTVGYQAPERVRLEYAWVSVADLVKDVVVSDEEIMAYYEDHRDEFQASEAGSEESGEREGDDDSQEDAEAAPSEILGNNQDEPRDDVDQADTGGEPAGDGAVKAVGDEAPESGVGAGPAEAQGEGDKPEEASQEAGPTAEVREKILKLLAAQKAREAARAKIDEVLDDLENVAEAYVNQPSPIERMAKRHRVPYERARTDAGDALLSRTDVRRNLPGGSLVASRVFDENLEVDFPSFVDTQKGPLVIQVLERRAPEAHRFEEVQDQVRRDVLRLKGLEKARIVAEKLKESAAGSSLDEAVGEMNERLRKVLGGPEAAPQAPRQESDGTVEAAEAEDTQPTPLLTIRETDFIPRSTTYVPALLDSRPNVVRQAFRLAAGEMAVVTEEGARPACYVVEKVAEKPAPPELFHERGELQRILSTYERRHQAVEGWLAHLLKQSPAPLQAED